MELRTRLYISKEYQKWKEKTSVNYENIKTCDVKTIENGYILPYIGHFKNTVERVLSGGYNQKKENLLQGIEGI